MSQVRREGVGELESARRAVMSGTQQSDKSQQEPNWVEEELYRIARVKSEVDKQQEMYKLLQSVHLPRDSADVHARRLTYPEMFEGITAWLRDVRAERRAQRMANATWVAAICALVSALCALVAILKR